MQILSKIFRELNQSDLKMVRLVCKKWKKIAKPHLILKKNLLIKGNAQYKSFIGFFETSKLNWSTFKSIKLVKTEFSKENIYEEKSNYNDIENLIYFSLWLNVGVNLERLSFVNCKLDLQTFSTILINTRTLESLTISNTLIVIDSEYNHVRALSEIYLPKLTLFNYKWSNSTDELIFEGLADGMPALQYLIMMKICDTNKNWIKLCDDHNDDASVVHAEQLHSTKKFIRNHFTNLKRVVLSGWDPDKTITIESGAYSSI